MGQIEEVRPLWRVFMRNKNCREMRKSLLKKSCLISLVCSTASLSTQAQLLNLSDLPVTNFVNAETNLILTLANSTEMNFASSDPNRLESYWSLRSSRAFQFNKLAYNPEFNYSPPVDVDGVSLGDADFNTAVRDFYTDTPETHNLEDSYRAVVFVDQLQSVYVDAFTCGAELCSGDDPAYYYRHLSAEEGCNAELLPDIEDCYERVEVTASFAGENEFGRDFDEEKTNFANWYQYYAIRLDAAKTALSIAFSTQNLDSNIRVGRQTLDDSLIQSGSSGSPVEGVASFSIPGERENFFDWLVNVETDASSFDLRNAFERAGQYISQTDAYRDIPQNSSSSLQTCRRNEHIYVGGSDRSLVDYDTAISLGTGSFNDDNSALSLPDGELYSPATSPIYAGPRVDTLSDITFNYWSSDAIGDSSDNDVPLLLANGTQQDNLSAEEYFNPENDPAEWQHLRTSVAGFRSSGEIDFSDPDVFNALLNGTLSWPDPESAESIVDDLAHAAVNGRGRFVNVQDASTLFPALTSAVSLPDSDASFTAVASSSGRVGSSDLVFTAEFDTELNIGRVIATRFSDGSDFIPGVAGSSCNERIFGTLCGEVWDAARENTTGSPLFSDREIISFDPDRNEGVEFSVDALNDDQISLLRNGLPAGFEELLIDYISGRDDITIGGVDVFRNRLGPDEDANAGITYLGPIVHSAPLYVSNGEGANGVRTFNFSDDLESESYSAYVEQTIANRPPMVLVGSNDGMMHAFDAASGQEVFAYVPNEIIGKLPEYADRNGGYVPLVDGPLNFQDAFVDSDWITMVVGGLRTGGQAYFALDVSDVSENNINAEDIAMWEFSDEDDADLGYSFGEAQIVRTNHVDSGTNWAVLVPSGYNSTESDGNRGSGRAYLYVLDPEDGSIIEKIRVGSSSDNQGSPNGLSGITAVTVDDDINVEFVYAGDLKGRLWKFDLSSSNSADWDASLLFDAGDDQPITAKPAVGRRPDGGPGRVVYFGTGQLLQASDVSDSEDQSFFGILDDDSGRVRRSELVRQTFSGSDNRIITDADNVVDFSSVSGFRIELGGSGGSAERVIAEPVLMGATVAFLSLLPENGDCGVGTANFLNVVSRLTGGFPPDPPIVDELGEPLLVSGSPVVGIRLDNDFPLQALTILSSGDGESSFNTPLANPAGNLGVVGRLRWRQLR